MLKISTAALVCAASAAILATPACAQGTSPPPASGAPLPPVIVEQKPAPAAAPPVAQPKPAPSAMADDVPAKPKPKRKPIAQSAPQSPAGSAPSAPAAQSSAPALPPDQPVILSGPGAVGVGNTGLSVPATTTVVTTQSLAEGRVGTSDTASLLRDVPGVAVYTGGGVSGLPTMNGLADDRIKIVVSSMAVTSACGNHMNSPLSYIDPANIGSIEVVSGVTPVSKGGDNIAGTIIVEPRAPNFAAPGQGVRTSGQLASFYRSNGEGFGGSVSAEAATERFSMRYDGAGTKSEDYDRGDDGKRVRSTEYAAHNHTGTLSARIGRDFFMVQAGVQFIPYQGYVNQRMDMVDNHAQFVNARWVGRFDWGTVDTRLFFQHTSHEMNFLEDKLPSNMPMRTEGKDLGYSVKAEIPILAASLLRLGNELHAQRLDDWWPPICSGGMMCMMGPLDFKNITDGTRDRLGTFVELETRWTSALTTLLGVRNDVVWSNAGNAQPYAWTGMMNAADQAAAIAFNARDHKRTDVNFDLTAMARLEPDLNSTYEIGYARKTRSPNLYERYTWGRGNMAMNMIGWFGDANGYVGDLDLKPEVAHTASVTLGWHDAGRSEWELKATPYYTYVEDFIDANRIGTVVSGVNQFAQLRFANHDATLYGVNVSGRMPLFASADFGRFALAGTLGYVHGERSDGSALYHMMPLNGRVGLTHRLGGWSSTIETVLVDDKTRLDERRLEPATPAYALLNLRTSYEWQNLRFDLAAENLLDKLYYSPLGGLDFADFKAEGGRIGPVPGMGRSINAGVAVKF
jgi:iron complex outermembrane receptor protein